MGDDKSDTLEIDSKIIELVKANPALYSPQKRAAPYERSKNCGDIWKSIGTSLGVDGTYCLLRWKALRHKFYTELKKSKEISSVPECPGNVHNSNWPLFSKMIFLKEAHNKHSSMQSAAKDSTAAKVAAPTDEGLLQEAMEEQNSVDKEKQQVVVSGCTSSVGASDSPSTTMKQIECLLGGLGAENRCKAEKRILAYLCKCQLNILNGDDIDRVAF